MMTAGKRLRQQALKRTEDRIQDLKIRISNTNQEVDREQLRMEEDALRTLRRLQFLTAGR